VVRSRIVRCGLNSDFDLSGVVGGSVNSRFRTELVNGKQILTSNGYIILGVNLI
jgi:hypothetical protein